MVFMEPAEMIRETLGEAQTVTRFGFFLDPISSELPSLPYCWGRTVGGEMREKNEREQQQGSIQERNVGEFLYM